MTSPRSAVINDLTPRLVENGVVTIHNKRVKLVAAYVEPAGQLGINERISASVRVHIPMSADLIVHIAFLQGIKH